MTKKEGRTVAGVLLAAGTGVLAGMEVIPGWGFVICILLAAFLVYPDTVGKFLKDVKDVLTVRGS